MDKTLFLQKVYEIFDREGIISYDEKLLHVYLDDERKNSVVTLVKQTDGSSLFFKALKPTCSLRGFLDYEKGILVSDIIREVGDESAIGIKKHGHKDGIKYLFTEPLPISHTLSDDSVASLSQNDAVRIRSAYQNCINKISNFIVNHQEKGALLYKESYFWESHAFFGQMVIFEKQLVSDGLLQKTGRVQMMQKFRQGIEEADLPNVYLVHGDLAPHNIIFSDTVYFIDWERAFITKNPLIGTHFDLANLYVYSYKNPSFQSTLWSDELEFKQAVLYHLLYKTNSILAFNRPRDEFFKWCIQKLQNF